MNSFIPTHRHLINGLVAVIVVMTANLAAEAEIVGTAGIADDGATDAAVEYELIAAPPPITGITGPELLELPDLDDVEFVVPVLSRPKLELPAPPDVDVESIRAKAAAWLGDGVMPAPVARIEVEAPDVSTEYGLDAPTIEVPALQRPELSTPPIR